MVSWRLDSPLPILDDSRFCWPTLPPITEARTTKRIQPRMAVLRCVALHRPARAAKLRGCIVGSSSRGVVKGTSGDLRHCPNDPVLLPTGLPASLGGDSPASRWGFARPAVRPAALGGAAGRAPC